MTAFYGDSHRALQDRFDTRRLADALESRVLRQQLTAMDQKFIASVDMFFLSTVDHNGYPTVSYKGGFPGFIRVIDSQSLAFPIYDGNGMFYSTGNIGNTAKIGMLFIDFLQPRRLRVHGTASVADDDPLMKDYHEARLVVRVAVSTIFTNCARYIHRYERLAASKYVPREGTETPVPDWKRVDYLQAALPPADADKARGSGPVMSEAEYRKDFWRGLE